MRSRRQLAVRGHGVVRLGGALALGFGTALALVVPAGMAAGSSVRAGRVGHLRPSASVPTWSVTSPQLTGLPVDPDAKLNAVTCPSAVSCFAVGSYLDSGGEQPLVLTEVGGRWSSQALSLPDAGAPGAEGGALLGVGCTSSTACLAVGTYEEAGQQYGLVASLHGGSWSSAEAPAITGGPTTMESLRDVSCSKAGSCEAAGVLGPPSTQQATYLLAWSSSNDEIVAETGPQPADASSIPDYSVEGVACEPDGACVVVGDYVSSAGGAGLLLSDESGAWGVEPIGGVPVGSSEVELDGVSCPSDGGCTAVGTAEGSTTNEIAVTESAGAWTASDLPVPSDFSKPGSGPDQISCNAPSVCRAVGSYETASLVPEAVLWSDTTSGWSATEAPVPTGLTTIAGLAVPAIACDASGTCVAPEELQVSTTSTVTAILSEQGGAWSVSAKVAVPASAPALAGPIVDSAACFTTAHCLLAGSYFDNVLETEPVVLHWTSGVVTVTRPSLPAGAGVAPDVQLLRSSCGAADTCTTLGAVMDPPLDMVTAAAAEVLNAGSWTTTRVALPPSVLSDEPTALSLAGISCVAATDCTAVGSATVASDPTFSGNSATVPVAFSEVSGVWSAAALPIPTEGAATNPQVTFGGLSCGSSRNCVAIGQANTANSPVLYVQSGAAWTLSLAGAVAGASTTPSLVSVSCPSGGGCVVLGYAKSGDLEAFSLSAGTWTAVLIKIAGLVLSPGSTLDCTSVTSCEAAAAQTFAQEITTVVITESGSTWTTESASGTGSDVQPGGISCWAADSCEAVGNTAVANASTAEPFALTVNGTSLSQTSLAAAGVQYLRAAAAISCAAATECAALDGPDFFTLSSGTWAASPVPLPANEQAFTQPTVGAPACSSGGVCIAAAEYPAQDEPSPQSFIATTQLAP